MTEVHLVVMIHGLWGGPQHLAAAKEELVKAWKASRGDSSVIEKHTIETRGDDPTITTELENGKLGERRRSRRLQEASSKSEDTGPGSSTPSKSRKVNGNGDAIANGGGQEEGDLVVVIAGGMTSQLTYDGIDVNASRVAWEIDNKIEDLEGQGKKVTKFSVLGYSLGGLVGRYLIGLLHSRTPSFFDLHRPVSFTTVACPHLGIPRYNTAVSTILVYLGARLLARSGRQLYVADKYSKADPRPLLEIMADPNRVFYQAMSSFERIEIYANGRRDFTVPYPSAALESTDPFVEWEEQKVVVESDDDEMMISWRYPEGPDGDVEKKRKKWKNPMGSLPPVVKDRFRRNYTLLIVFPVLLPFLMILMMVRMSMDARRSSNRTRVLAPLSPDSFTIPSSSGLNIDSLRDLVGKTESHLESRIIHELDSPITEKSPQTGAIPTQSSSSNSPTGPRELDLPYQQIRFKDSQKRMLEWLNRLPIRKHVTWYNDIPNAHAAIICRDPSRYPGHNRGRGVLRSWAKTILEEE